MRAVVGNGSGFLGRPTDGVFTHEAFDEVIELLRETLEDFELDPPDIDHVVGEMEARRPVIVGERVPASTDTP